MRRNKQSVQSAILRPHGSKLTGISIGWRVHWSSKTSPKRSINRRFSAIFEYPVVAIKARNF